jgi:hypothetical protein
MAKIQKPLAGEQIHFAAFAVILGLALPALLIASLLAASWRKGPVGNPWQWWMLAVLFAPGALLALLNFFLSFLRYPLHRCLGRSRETYRHVSGAPGVGTVATAIATWAAWGDPRAVIVAAALCVLDTGGLPWFMFSVIGERFRDWRKNRDQSDARPADPQL